MYIYIGTNNNKVWRIAVADAYPRDETNIRIRFNKLCSQFERNKKYFEANINSSAYIDYTIPDDEDISYEMKVNKNDMKLFILNCRIQHLLLNNYYQDMKNRDGIVFLQNCKSHFLI